jgi:hypothetical protein
MSICRECKKPFNEYLTPHPRDYCTDLCMRMYSLRAYKQRKGIITPQPCNRKQRMALAECVKCSSRPWHPDNPACGKCHEVHATYTCERARQLYGMHARKRQVCPADCRACPHGTPDPAQPVKPTVCPTCGQPMPGDTTRGHPRGDDTQTKITNPE